MPQNAETPAGVAAGASRDLLAGGSLPLDSAARHQAQFLTIAHHLRPALADVVAAAAFSGGCNG